MEGMVGSRCGFFWWLGYDGGYDGGAKNRAKDTVRTLGRARKGFRRVNFRYVTHKRCKIFTVLLIVGTKPMETVRQTHEGPK